MTRPRPDLWSALRPALLLSLAGCLSLTLAAGSTARAATKDVERGNGIIVGRPKLFDERALQAMLRQAETNLASLRFFSQDPLAQALGRVQGATLDATAASFQLTPLPIPGVKTETTNTSGTETKVVTTGEKDGSTTTTTDPNSKQVQTVDRGQVTVQPPPASIPASAFTAPAVNGIASQDLLAEQEALTFQVINLRLLLQGALSDRIAQSTTQINDKAGNYYGDRVQAVIGIPITLDAPHHYKNRVAEVVMTVHPPAESPAIEQDAGVSLVTMFPREKTYNVAAVRRSATNIGLGAVVQVFSVGFSGSRNRETLYLVKDTDTVAVQRLGPALTPGAVRFGWQFRPTLGRSVVDPGTRQVFAVIAVPRSLRLSDLNCRIDLETRWREFHKSSKVAGEVLNKSRQPGFPSGTNTALTILDPGTRDEQLRPDITRVEWTDLGNGSLQVAVHGANFAPETRVQVGSTALGSSDVVLQGDSRLIFAAPAAAVFGGKISLVGTYGAPQPLFEPDGPPQANNVAPVPLRASLQSITTVDSKSSEVRLQATLPLDGAPGDRELIRHLNQAVVNLGGTYYGVGARSLERAIRSRGRTLEADLRFVAPTETLQDERELSVELTRQRRHVVERVTFDPGPGFTISGVQVLPAGDGKRLLISGRNFRRGIEAEIKGATIREGTYLVRESPAVLNLVLNKAQATDLKEVLLRQGTPPAVRSVAVPPEDKKDDPPFAIAEKVYQHEVVTVKVSGTKVKDVRRVEFEGKALRTTPENPTDAEPLTAVKLTADVTKEPGRRELDLFDKDGKRIPGPLTVLGVGK